MNRRWSTIITSDPILRRRARRKVRAVRKLSQRSRENTFPQKPPVQVSRTHPGVLQERINGTVRTESEKIRYETDYEIAQQMDLTDLTTVVIPRVVRRKSKNVPTEKRKRVAKVEAPAKKMRML